MEQFDFDFQPSINKEQIMELATMRFVENKENVVFLGTPGVGKTHLAVSLRMIAAQHMKRIPPFSLPTKHFHHGTKFFQISRLPLQFWTEYFITVR